jgi:hypothetical protein
MLEKKQWAIHEMPVGSDLMHGTRRASLWGVVWV